MNADEATRRKSNTDKLREFFLARPLVWVDAVDLEPVAGRQAWRSRVSDLRHEFNAEGIGTIENRQQRQNTIERATDGLPTRLWLGPVLSQYRYLPYKKLGRDAETKVPALPLFPGEGPWQRP